MRDYSSTIWLVNTVICLVKRCHVSKQIYDSSPPVWTSLVTINPWQEAQSLKTEVDVENFMMEQNQRMVDTLALEVDRLEYLIKVVI